MPRPTEHPDWATAPSSPTDIVRPPAARIADGWNPAERPPAQYWNWWQNLVGQWARWLDESTTSFEVRLRDIERRIRDDEWVYPAPKLRTVILMPDDGADSTSSTGTLPGWVRNPVVFAGPVGGLFPSLRALTSDASWTWQLKLPTGGRLRRIRVRVQPGIARVIARIQIRVFSVRVSFGGTAIASDAETGNIGGDDGTTALQSIEVAPAFAPVDNASRVYFVEVRAGRPTAPDLVHAVEVQFEDPGPRN
jgi:hypothetical protein